MSGATGMGNQRPDPDQDQDQIWGSVFNDPTAPFWDGPVAPVPMPRADDASPAPFQEPPPLPPERPVPPAPPGAEPRTTGAAYRNRRRPAAPQGSPPAGPPMSNRYAQQPPVQQPPAQQPYATAAPAKTHVWANIRTILAILSLVGPRPLDSLEYAFTDLNKSSRDPRSSRGLNNAGWIVFAVAGVVGFVGFIVHAIFPF